MNALLNPVTPKKSSAKWIFVVHTTAMFSVVTVFTSINIYFLSVVYIDNREFTGTDGYTSGPIGYEGLVSTGTLKVASNVLFVLNQWLADGLLASSMSESVAQLPNANSALPLQHHLYYELLGRFLPVLDVPRLFRYALDCSYANVISLANAGGKAMGILYFHWLARPDGFYWVAPMVPEFDVAFWSISIVLNLLLMLLIVIRLGLHHMNVRNVMGGAAGAGGLYKAVIAILIESFSLHAINFLL